MKLIRANINDCEKIWKMQKEAFADLLEKYQDYETSPANEPVEKIKAKLLDNFTYFYFIYDDDALVGAVRVVHRNDGSRKRIAPIFIMKEFRGKGLAQKTFEEIEKIHGSDNWSLDTILQETGNCYLYEKLGYKKTGVKEKNQRPHGYRLLRKKLVLRLRFKQPKNTRSLSLVEMTFATKDLSPLTVNNKIQPSLH